MLTKYAKGMVYWISLPRTYGDTVQSGRRPCVIVSNNMNNVFSENITVVPCTSNLTKKDSIPTHTTVRLLGPEDSVVLCEDILTISKKMCEAFIGLLDDQAINDIDEHIKIALGLTSFESASYEENTVEPSLTKNKEDKQKRMLEEHEKTTNPNYMNNIEAQKKYIEEYEKYGVDYILANYNIKSRNAAIQRKNYYKNKLTKLRK